MATFNIRNSQIGQITDSGTNINNGQVFTTAEAMQAMLQRLQLAISSSDAGEREKTDTSAAIADVQQSGSQPPSPQTRMKLHEKIAVLVGMLTTSEKLAAVAEPYLPLLSQLKEQFS